MYQYSRPGVWASTRFALAIVGGFIGLGVSAAHSPALPAGPDLPAADIQAVYRISLAGFELGTFRYNSTVSRGRYTLDTDVELSALLGAFHWKGATRATGTIEAAKPKPAGFLFEYQSTARNGSVKMNFGQEGIDTISIDPPEPPEPGLVPLQRAHLSGVLDPLSAIIAATHVDGPNPCGRKLALFDGKQRFDLDFQFARTQPLQGTKETAIVCRIRYTPIAGYAPSDETMAMAQTRDIEIAFRPVPQVKLMLPQYVRLPTAAGTAEIVLVSINITAAHGQVASVD